MGYDSGTIFSPAVLDITDEDIKKSFMAGVRNIAAVSLAINYPTTCSAPHSIVNGFRNLLAIAVTTDIDFAEADQTKEYLKDPSKSAAAAAAAKKEESEEESDDDMGFGLF